MILGTNGDTQETYIKLSREEYEAILKGEELKRLLGDRSGYKILSVKIKKVKDPYI